MRRLQLLLLVVLAGCSFFSRTRSTIYSIETIPGTALNVLGAPIGIDSIELPPGFDRREIVVCQANQQLDVRGTQLWSASLQPLVLHTLAFDLAGRLPAGMVILPGQAKPAAMRSIDLVFEQIAAGPDNHITLDARWTLAGVSRREQIAVPIDSLDSEKVAEGMGRALGELADRMAIAAGQSPGPRAQR